VYILNSKDNEIIPSDEEPIPDDGNPHHFPGNHPENQNQDMFDNIQDLNEVQQANEDEGWVPPLLPNAAAVAENNG
jgi:hypothetical protein